MFRTYLNWSKAEIRIFLFTNWKMERKSVCRIKTLEQKTNCLKRLKPKVGGADNLYRGHFILNYIYNSEKALPGQMPWLPRKTLSGDHQGRQRVGKLSQSV